MKKLLVGLSIAVLSAASIQSQPIAQNATFEKPIAIVEKPPYSYVNNLSHFPLVSNGTPPYSYHLVPDTARNTNPSIRPDGRFLVVPISIEDAITQFQYTVTDANGNISNPGTVTIKFGNQKG